jgi:hypothetical protein
MQVTWWRLVEEYERLEEPAVSVLVQHNTGVNLKPNIPVDAEWVLDVFTT